MNFQEFRANFHRDEDASSPWLTGATANQVSERADESVLRDQFGGASFNDGLYRIMDDATANNANALIVMAFPELSLAKPISYDWLGRIFALDNRRIEEGLPGVTLIEPGTGKSLSVPCNIVTLHNEGLTKYADAALAARFYKEWRTAGGLRPKFNQCIGYKKPLFLGGKDTVENLEISDLDVYWTISAQLIAKVRGLRGS